MNYELCKKLNKTGFPVRRPVCANPCEGACFPTLSELIEACGNSFTLLSREQTDYWRATGSMRVSQNNNRGKTTHQYSTTPEEAVANLWLKLNEK